MSESKWYLKHIRDHEYSDEYPKDHFSCDIVDENNNIVVSEFIGSREVADRIISDHNQTHGIEDLGAFLEKVRFEMLIIKNQLAVIRHYEYHGELIRLKPIEACANIVLNLLPQPNEQVKDGEKS